MSETADHAPITAMILAGGMGTRLRTVVADRPKVMALVLGRPFITYLFDQVLAAGARHAILCTGYMAEQIEATFGQAYRGSSGELRLSYSRETEPLGTGGAMRLAAPMCETDAALVLNGDAYCHADLIAFRAFHAAQHAAGSLLLAQVPDTSRFGRVQTDDAAHVTRFEEKGGHSGPGPINAGIYLLSQAVLQSIPPNRAVSIERETFPAWIGRGLFGYASGASRFIDIGTPESYAAAELFFAEIAR